LETDSSRWRRVANTARTSLIGALVVITGGLMLWLSGAEKWVGRDTGLSTLLNQLGGLLIVTGGVSLLWELRTRREFADELFAKARLGSDVQQSGLERVSMQWLEEVAWTDLFKATRDVEIFLSYGRTWRSNNAARLDEFVKRKGTKLSIYLPDPGNDHVMHTLALRYDATPEKIAAEIKESARGFAALALQGKCNVRVYYRDGDPSFACYKFNTKTVVTLYSHKRRRGDVPTFVLGPGSLRDYFDKELEAIRTQSQEQSLASLEGGPQA
jgi:hypothetical protein